MVLQTLIEEILGRDLPVRVVAYDGTDLGPRDAPATITVRSPRAFRWLLWSPDELGFGRAHVVGDIDVEGDLYAVLSLRDRLPDLDLGPRQVLAAARLAGVKALRRPEPPPEEVRLRGARHSRTRDAAAIAHHYDISNDFYRLVLGPSMTYSCAVFEHPDDSLEAAQANKYELISRKLGLAPGRRLLDVGCGWGGMALHAAAHHGVRVVGVTVSRRQVELAEKRVADAGVADLVEIREQDYREVDDGPFDAISSIGMFEHVGLARLSEYFTRLRGLLAPGGRLLNHAISRPPGERARFARTGFIDRYVFPDGELHEVGSVVSAMQAAGFEARHVESLREHYALTLRQWVRNLEEHWAEAVAEVGPNRARVWRLYMAASALNFEANRTQIHQILGVNTGRGDQADAGLGLRPRWDARPLGA